MDSTVEERDGVAPRNRLLREMFAKEDASANDEKVHSEVGTVSWLEGAELGWPLRPEAKWVAENFSGSWIQPAEARVYKGRPTENVQQTQFPRR